MKFGNPPCKVPSQARLLENAILTGRDVLEGTVTSSERMFFPGVERKWEFPSGVNDFNLLDNRLTRAPFYTPALWGHSDGQIRREQDRAGLFLAPCKWGYHAEPLVLDCLAMRFRMGAAAGWYNDLNLRSPHTFRPGGVEFTDYVLEHYMPLLERVDLYHSVYAAKFHYPIFQGICCGLMEVFLKELKTFYTAKGDTSLDLWSLHQISGLPLDGEPYDECCPGDEDKDSTDSEGNYQFGRSLRFWLKHKNSIGLWQGGGQRTTGSATSKHYIVIIILRWKVCGVEHKL